MPVRLRVLLPATAILFALAACGSAPASAPPAASSGDTNAAAPSSAAPSKRASRSADADCPSAKALEELADLPKDWRFVPSSVDCWMGWATAAPEGPDLGDGIYLFRYQPGTGWRFHSEGSGYHCEDLGIEEAAPFCQYP